VAAPLAWGAFFAKIGKLLQDGCRLHSAVQGRARESSDVY